MLVFRDCGVGFAQWLEGSSYYLKGAGSIPSSPYQHMSLVKLAPCMAGMSSADNCVRE